MSFIRRASNTQPLALGIRSSSFSGKETLDPKLEALIRSLGVINCLHLDTIKHNSHNLEKLCNSNYYQNILHDLFLDYLDSESKNYYNKIKSELGRLSYYQNLYENSKGVLDRHYALTQYMDWRKWINDSFNQFIKGLEADTGLSINQEDLIYETKKVTPESIIILVRKIIFKSLTLQFKDQLTTLSPYGQRFVGKKPHKVLKEILMGLTDYQYFHWTYRSGGHRNYLSAYCTAIEKISKRYLGSDSLTVKRLQLVDSLWNAYVGFISLENMVQKFSLYLKNDNDLPDLDNYLSYISKSTTLIVKELKVPPVIVDTEILDNYNNYIKTYIDILDTLLTNLQKIETYFKAIMESHQGSAIRGESSTSQSPEEWIGLIKLHFSSQMSVLKIIQSQSFS